MALNQTVNMNLIRQKLIYLSMCFSFLESIWHSDFLLFQSIFKKFDIIWDIFLGGDWVLVSYILMFLYSLFCIV